MAHHEAAIIVGLALALGMIAQSLARHLKLPGIVLLLAAGVLLGPDLAGVIVPEKLGPALQILVGFAVAVILFEGGMSLNVKRLGRQARVIRRLLTHGAAITAFGGMVTAHWLMGWSLELSILFGTLVVVTGPTVITPLLRRIKVRHNVETVLEAEGVLIDAVGAVMAVVGLQLALSFSASTFAAGLLDMFASLGLGAICGLAGGFLIALLLRFDKVVPEGLENVFTLSLVLALYQLSSAAQPESGILAVTVAGMVLGNVHTRVQRDLLEFKEQLTVMLIGMLFILLAAGVRVEAVRSLGWRGVAAVAILMFLVRPLNITVSTSGSGLTAREKGFLSWLAPRGIVAAAIASLAAQELASKGIAGGDQLQALVFMVIGVTVVVQGLSGGLVARLLGLRRAVNRGYAILGANELGHALGRLLRDSGEEVLFLDSNPSACHTVEQDGFKVIFGNVLEERTLQRAELEDRAACIGVTQNEEANLLFGQKAIGEFKVPRAYLGLVRGSSGVNEAVVRKAGGAVLFAAPRDLELWALRLRRGTAPIEIWRYDTDPAEVYTPDRDEQNPFDTPESRLLPLVIWRGQRVFPANDGNGLRQGDLVHFAICADHRDEARAWLRERGWAPVYEPEPEKVPDEAEELELVGTTV